MPPDRAPAHALYRILLALYPQSFRDRHGESMEQTFADLWREHRAAGGGAAGFLLRTFVETSSGIVREHLFVLFHAPMTKNTRLALIGVLLCVPFVILFTMLQLNIEPNFGPLEPLLASRDPDQPDVIGSLIAVTILFFLPLAALLLNLAPVRQALRAGGGLLAKPGNLALVVVAFSFVALFVGAIIVDQYPCWIGVPNCD